MEATTAMVESGPSVEILYRTDGERLWRALYAFCGDEEIAGDAVNEAFAQPLGLSADPVHLWASDVERPVVEIVVSAG